MGRKAGVSPEETRRAVLDAAMRSFAELGYHGASTRSIGAAASLTIGAVHHHFGSKGELYAACVTEADARLAGLIARALEAANKDGVKAAARVAVSALGEPGVATAFRIIARRMWEDPEGTIDGRLKAHGGALAHGGELLASLRKDITPLQARIRVQSAIYALARFALAPEQERRFLTGADSEDEATRLLEEELAVTLTHIVSG